MNVANTTATPVGSESLFSGGGKGTGQTTAAFGSLLAAEMTGMLEQFQASMPDSLLVSADKDTGETEVSDLLAMLEQLLQSGAQAQLSMEATILNSQQANEEDQNVPAASFLQISADDSQRLVSTFMQQGMSKEEASRMVELLKTLAEAQAADKQPMLQKASEQVVNFLNRMGIEWNLQDTGQAKKEESGLPAASIRKTTPFLTREPRFVPAQPGQADNHQNLLPHQVNTALAKYQPGMTVKQIQPHVSIEQLLQSMGKSTTEAGKQTAADAVSAEPILNTGIQTHQQSSATVQNQTGFGTNSQLVRADQFTKDMTNLFVKQMKIVGGNGFSEAKLILHPQSLGQVDVRITANNHVITAHFAADSQAGKELLDNQLPQLRAALQQIGLQVDRLEVTQQQSQPQHFGFSQQREGQRNHQEQQQSESNEQQAEFNIEALTQENESAATTWLKAKQAKVEYSV